MYVKVMTHDRDLSILYETDRVEYGTIDLVEAEDEGWRFDNDPDFFLGNGKTLKWARFIDLDGEERQVATLGFIYIMNENGATIERVQ